MAGRTDPPSRVIRAVVDPPAGALAAFAQSGSDFLAGVFSAGSLVRENRALKAEAQAAQLYDARLAELETEIDNLRKLQGYPAFPGKQRVSARLLGVFPAEYRVTIGAGTAEGVAEGMPVVAANGLLGIVQTSDAHTSQATLAWAPPPFKMGGLIEGKPKSAGLLSGEGDNIDLELNLDMPVKIGDTVVTSGFSEKIPRGIPIGRVTQVQQDRDFGVEHVTVAPAVFLGDVQEVFVIK